METLKNQKRQGFDTPVRLPGNIHVIIKFAHLIYAGDTHFADKTAASQHIKDILKAVRNRAIPEDAGLPANEHVEAQTTGSQNDDNDSTARARNQSNQFQESKVLQKLVDQVRTIQEQMQGIMLGN